MTASSIEELEREFTATHGGKFMSRDGAAERTVVEPCDGMYLGRCFLISDAAAARLCQQYKPHPKLMVTIQDDAFFNAFREHGSGSQ